MNQVKCVLVLASLFIPLFLTCVNAENIPSDRKALRGLKQIGVKVGEISPSAEGKGVNRKYLRRNIESILRSGGIVVVDHDQLDENNEISYLLVTVLLSYNEPTYNYVLMLGLNEKVHLARDQKIISYAIPWWRIMKGEHFGNLGLVNEIDKTLVQLLNEFTRDYFAVNPAEKTIQPGGE